MLPRWHIIFGAIFSALIWIVSPKINPIFILLIFFSSFLIDFDHYLSSVLKSNRLSLFHAFEYHRKLQKEERRKKRLGLREKGDFHLFHTIEFHILMGLLSFVWIGFFYIFLGMIFHSLLDLYSLIYEKDLYQREYFLVNWLRKKISK